MAYEREAIPDSTSVPAQGSPIMREERTFDPYAVRGPKVTTQPIGQGNTHEGAEAKPEETVTLSPQVAALARREQKFRLQQQMLAQERAKLEAERQEIADLKAMKAKLAAKDYSGLDGLVDYNDFSQYQINKLNGSDPNQEEFRNLKTKVDELEKFSEENVSRQYEAAVHERRVAAKDLVESKPEFATIKKANAQEAIVKHITDTYELDDEELSVEQAAKEVEMVLLEKAKQWAALLEEQKVEEVPVVSPQAKKQLPPLKQGLKTLTNQVTAGDALKRPAKPYHLLNDADRYAQARELAQAKLQQQTRR